MNGHSTTKNSTSGFNNNNIKNSYSTYNSSQNYGTIKRSNSNSKKNTSIERPSTAPQKNDKNEDKVLTSHSSLKRLPSPNIKCKDYLFNVASSMNNSVKNIDTGINMAKYRSPSPATMNKSSTITMGSLKTAGNKTKWK